ncbi:MAG: hypothetical protein ACR2NB_04970, partial [Solirubrobacteraceae bacterium]
PRPKGGAPAGARSSLPAATRRALERDGADGAAAAALAENRGGSASSGKRAAPADRAPRQSSVQADAGTLPAIGRTIGGGGRQGGGFGGWVPLVLAGILVVFAALGIRRRRGGGGGAPA